MRKTRRARRMKKRHSRTGQRQASLNMISLMDIFTILVFFLLVNTASEEVLPSTANIILPDSVSEQTPTKNLVIAVDAEVIRLQGNIISRVQDVLNSSSVTIRPLADALKATASSADSGSENSVTIMGDRDIPYALLKRIMLTCAGAGYPDLSLAVNRKASGAGG